MASKGNGRKHVFAITRETHEAPASVQRVLELFGGHNRFGEANFRAVWSENRLDWVAGKWVDTDPVTGEVLREVFEARYVPKYWPLQNRWIIERWYPPEHFGSPQRWYEVTKPAKDYHEHGNLAKLGPYPHRGRYQDASIIQDGGGEFVPLTVTLAEEVVWLFEKKRREKVSLAQAELRYKAELAENERKQRERNLAYLDSFSPAYYGAPTTFQVGGSRESI